MLLFQRILLVAVVSLISGAVYAQSSSSSPQTSIKMLPPSDFSGNVCNGAKIGMLQWDSVNPIRCVPGFIGDSNGSVGIGTATPKSALDVNGEARIGNSGASCTSANEGAMRYNRATHNFEGCDNTGTWRALTAIGFGGVYQMYICDTSGNHHSQGTGCRLPNKKTGSCTCPAGYSPVHLNDFDSPVGRCPQQYYENRGMISFGCY